MTVTLNTDASFHPTLRVGAFAFWIVCEQGRLVQSGPLKNPKTAHDAELQCIANALYAIFVGSFTSITHIYINTDCKYGIDSMTKGKHIGQSADTVKYIHGMISQLKSKYNYRDVAGKKKGFVSWRYVPAHTSGSKKRTWVNNRMDEMAKRALWRSINENKKKDI